LRRLEEEWINSEVNSNEEGSVSVHIPDSGGKFYIASSSLHSTVIATDHGSDSDRSIGTYDDFLKGLIMGFILGLIILPFVSSISHIHLNFFKLQESTMSARTKVGIVTGLGVSITLGILKVLVF
jgi:hypothetical protein